MTLFFYLNNIISLSQLHMHLNVYSKRQIVSKLYLHRVTIQRPSYLKWKMGFGLTLLHFIFLILWSCRDTSIPLRLHTALGVLSSSLTLLPPLFCYRIPSECNLIQFKLLFRFDVTKQCLMAPSSRLLPRQSTLSRTTQRFPQHKQLTTSFWSYSPPPFKAENNASSAE